MARPRKYASDAERVAAHRARYATFQIRVEKETAETLDRIAEYLDSSRTEVVASLVKFALTNRNWMQQGLFGKRLPTAYRADFERIAHPDEDNEP